MKIEGIEIKNFRGIKRARATQLGDLVVLVGPNGSGKSCILDAIRLIKSVYGGYQANEWDLWMGEFQIGKTTKQWEFKQLLRDVNEPAELKLEVRLSEREVEYLREKQFDLMEEQAFLALYPGQDVSRWHRIKREGQLLDADTRTAIENARVRFQEQLNSELSQFSHTAHVRIHQTGQLKLSQCLTLTAVWRTFQLGRVGVIDYHGSHRNYAREAIGGINLNLQSQEEQQRQHALYNYSNKYTNIKTEMATEYVQETLRKKSGQRQRQQGQTLEETLRVLFKTFFPGKEFTGAQADPDGSLKFPVNIGSIEHDINELSSGEKEILYGYLRLRRSAPSDSIILLDEPELHLNPKLIQGLPQFYEQYLVRALGNQMLLVTHSDALLREALTVSRATVLHMQESKEDKHTENQLRRVEEHQDEEHVVMELVGDIAGYRPGGKVVIFEGINAGFDVRMTTRLFPEFDRTMNFIAGGGREGVERLHKCLESQDGGVGIEIYSIVDKDWHEKREGRNRFSWDVYHIENYLLDATYILDVVREITLENIQLNEAREVEEILRELAQSQIDELVRIQIQSSVNSALVRKLKFDAGKSSDLCVTLRSQASTSLEAMKRVLDSELSEATLKRDMENRKQELNRALTTDEWKTVFRGRDILNSFVNKYGRGMRYERFRDMIVNRMRERGFQPAGMRNLLRRIDAR